MMLVHLPSLAMSQLLSFDEVKTTLEVITHCIYSLAADNGDGDEDDDDKEGAPFFMVSLSLSLSLSLHKCCIHPLVLSSLCSTFTPLSLVCTETEPEDDDDGDDEEGDQALF